MQHLLAALKTQKADRVTISTEDNLQYLRIKLSSENKGAIPLLLNFVAGILLCFSSMQLHMSCRLQGYPKASSYTR